MAIPILVAIFIFAFRENVSYLNVDDLNAIVSGNPTKTIVAISLGDGRYLLAIGLLAFKAIGLDFVRDYAIFAALYGLAFAWFCKVAVAYITRDAEMLPGTVGVYTVLFGALAVTHANVNDLIAWKISFPHMFLLLVVLTACLRLLTHYPPSPKLGLQLGALMLAANLIYQPGTTAVLFLEFGWVLVSALSLTTAGTAATRHYVRHLAFVVSTYVAAGVGYILVLHLARLMMGIESARPFKLASPHAMARNAVYYHAKQVLMTFDPWHFVVGLDEGFPNVGGPLAAIALALVIGLIWTALRRSKVLPVALGLGGLVALLANPQNLIIADYYPSGRSCFYVSFFLPILLIGARAARPPQRWIERISILSIVVLAFQVTGFARLAAAQSERQQRDFAFAHRIVDSIQGDPRTRNLTRFRMPSRLPPTLQSEYWPGLRQSTSSLFSVPWARGALLSHVSGQRYTYLGEGKCPAETAAPNVIAVYREDDAVIVCY